MSLPREVMDRRVPQWLAMYIGASFGVVQFIDFIQTRYGLSPHWTDITLVALALLIPSVLLFTYFHGRPGKDELVRAEKVAIPLNILLTGVVLFLLFGNRNLGAVSKSITVVDEAGNEIERTVAQAGYRTNFALFNFDAPAGDTATTWLQYALPMGLSLDLLQDMFVEARVSASFRERLRQLGYKDEVGVPISLKRQLADEQHLQYFTDAKVSRAGAQVSVDFSLYETATGKRLHQHTFTNTDVLALIDEMSATVKHDLDVPESPDVKDLPVSEVLTSSLPAFRNYTDGMTAIYVRDQYPEAVRLLEKAVALDETFAMAQLGLHNTLLMSNQTAKAMPPLQKAMTHSYRLPERLQYDVKAEHYVLNKETDKALNIAKMKVSLFPQDLSGYGLLAQLQAMRDDKAGQIESYKKILELDPSKQELLREIGSLYQNLGDLDSALDYYSQVAEKFPARADSYLPTAELYRLKGNHAVARTAFEKAVLIDPVNVAAMVGLASIDSDLGRFDAAEKGLNEALAAARTADDRGSALRSLAGLYESRGQLRRALTHHEEMVAEYRKTSPPYIVAIMQLVEVGTYVKAGMPDAGQQIIDRLAKQLEPPFDMFVSLGQMEMAIERKQPDAAEAAVAVAEKSIQAFGFGSLMPVVAMSRGKIAQLRGNCDQALKSWSEFARLDPTDVGIHVYMASCYRQLGQPAKAVEEALITLKSRPAHPRANYELALAYIAAGDPAKAKQPLERAVAAWQNADPTFTLATDARAKLSNLQ